MPLTPVFLLFPLKVCTVWYLQKTEREGGRERWSGAQISVLGLSERKLLFSPHICCSANQANASIIKWEENHLTAGEDNLQTHTHSQINANLVPTTYSYGTDEFIHALLNWWQVSEISNPEQSLKDSGFILCPQRKETHETPAHQWRLLILQWFKGSELLLPRQAVFFAFLTAQLRSVAEKLNTEGTRFHDALTQVKQHKKFQLNFWLTF